MSQQEDARDILAALRGDNDPAEVAHPGAMPDTSRMNPEAAGQARAAHDKKMEDHVAGLLKPGRKLSQQEQKTLQEEIGKWNREQRG